MPQDIILSENSKISEDSPTFIIAEIGQNHQGDLEIAKKLIKAAKECGADCAKFQKTSPSDKFTKAALERPYDSEHSWGRTYGEHKAHLEFSNEQFKTLQSYGREIGILFTASPMDLVSLEFLCKLQVPFVKIGSGDANNFILIEEAAKKDIPLIISTGMQTLEVVKRIYKTVKHYHNNFVLLHCVSAYPTKVEDVNLNTLKLYKQEFPDVHIGYSGHELGTDITPISIALGAKVVERHITLDHNQKGSDHKCSLEPQEFAEMVRKIRSVERALGNPRRILLDCEVPCYTKLGKTLVAARNLTSSHKLQNADIKIKVNDCKGIDPFYIDEVVGGILLKDVEEDRELTEDCVVYK